jgi:hypothetical protein
MLQKSKTLALRRQRSQIRILSGAPHTFVADRNAELRALALALARDAVLQRDLVAGRLASGIADEVVENLVRAMGGELHEGGNCAIEL